MPIILPIIASGLCACSDKTEIHKPNLDIPYTCQASITKDDFSCKIMLSRNREGVWEATFTSPDTLSSMSVVGFGESYAIDYMGLSYTMPTENLPIGSIVSAITSSLDHASSSSSVKLKKEGSEIVASGDITCGQYDLRIDKSGEPIALHLGEGFTVQFEDFTKE